MAIKKTYQETVINLKGCDKCGHRWLPRGQEQPKKCPRCKSPEWNFLQLKGEGSLKSEDISMIAHRYGKETAEVLRCRIDKSFNQKKIKQDIAEVKSNLTTYKQKQKDINDIIKGLEAWLNDLEKELRSS